jgi:penicillin-binding protein 1A
VLARRQPGSAFKPFVWLAAIEHGARPGDAVLDAPIHLGGWQPEDFHHAYRGRISIEEALAESSNTAAVRLLLQAGGPRTVAAVAHRLGIAGRLPGDDSLALGTGEVGVLELAGAFAPFCNGGYRVGVHGVRAIVAGGQQRRLPPAVAQAVIAPAAAADMERMLAAVVSRGTGRAAAIAGRLVIGKTGTTQQSRDAWFVGCTGGVVLAIWLGNDDGAPMRGVTGGGLPARLFHTIGERIRASSP